MSDIQTAEQRATELLEMAIEKTEYPEIYKNRLNSEKLSLSLDILNYILGYDNNPPKFLED